MIVAEAGKPIGFANIEVDRAAFVFEAASKVADRFDDPIQPDLMNAPNATGRKVSCRFFPSGIVAAVTPFNFPLNLVAHKVAPAIASGNITILKPAPQTPLTSYLLYDVLKDSGLPAGWLSVLPCENDVAQQLVEHTDVNVVSFTGSANVGWQLKSLIPKKKVTLELGGNGAVIVNDVTDLDALVESLRVSAYAYAGQVCISLQNLYIKDSLYEEVLRKFVEVSRNVHVGNPGQDGVVVGPMISAQAAQKAWSWVEDALTKGAHMLCGGYKEPNTITPTILVNVPDSCSVTCEEVFAPVVVVHKYSDINSVIEQLNSSRYGLQVGLFSNDPNIITRVYRELEVGGVIVGDTNMFRIDTMPYGGVKDSGFGREGIEFAMRDMCEIKVLVEKS
jgi:acyl-CoA reductase-like NAD-dependent aldehyde dehydrogenase